MYRRQKGTWNEGAGPRREECADVEARSLRLVPGECLASDRFGVQRHGAPDREAVIGFVRAADSPADHTRRCRHDPSRSQRLGARYGPCPGGALPRMDLQRSRPRPVYPGAFWRHPSGRSCQQRPYRDAPQRRLSCRHGAGWRRRCHQWCSRTDMCRPFKHVVPGLFVYHCAVRPMTTHIANGTHGMILVGPEGPLPRVDREYAVMQNEFTTTTPVKDSAFVEYSPDSVGNIGPDTISSSHIVGLTLYGIYWGGRSPESAGQIHPDHAWACRRRCRRRCDAECAGDVRSARPFNGQNGERGDGPPGSLWITAARHLFGTVRGESHKKYSILRPGGLSPGVRHRGGVDQPVKLFQ
jgi:hypothetical protein